MSPTLDLLDPVKVRKELGLTKIVIGVDPAGSDDEDADETGIIVVGAGPHIPKTCAMPRCRRHGYVLEDATLDRRKVAAGPMIWARHLVETFHRWDADLVVMERTGAVFGWARELVWTVEKIPLKPVDAVVGKVLRAEPIAMLYDQGRVHHVGPPANLLMVEEQMTTWVEGDPNSPDRLDALVYAVAALEIRKVAGPPPAAQTFEQENPWAIESGDDEY